MQSGRLLESVIGEAWKEAAQVKILPPLPPFSTQSAAGRQVKCQCHHQRAPSSLRQSDRQMDKRMQHHYDKATQTYWRPPSHAVSLKRSIHEHTHTSHMQSVAGLFLLKHNLNLLLFQMQRIMQKDVDVCVTCFKSVSWNNSLKSKRVLSQSLAGGLNHYTMLSVEHNLLGCQQACHTVFHS